MRGCATDVRATAPSRAWIRIRDGPKPVVTPGNRAIAPSQGMLAAGLAVADVLVETCCRGRALPAARVDSFHPPEGPGSLKTRPHRRATARGGRPAGPTCPNRAPPTTHSINPTDTSSEPRAVDSGVAQKTVQSEYVVKASSAASPAAELPVGPKAGLHTQATPRSGMMARMPPPTPLFAGSPTR